MPKGPFKYYVIKEVAGWGGQMMIFDDKVGGWGWLNAVVIKKYTRKNTLMRAQKKKVGIFSKIFFSRKMIQNQYLICSFFSIKISAV